MITPRHWRLVDDLRAGHCAVAQMEADSAMLDDVAAGAPPVLRLYTWERPALSLGRFQPDDDVDRDACARLGVDVARRPTGGRGLLHGGDLTYAVAMPLPPGADGGVDAVYRRLAGGLIAGLARLGVTAAVARHDGPSGPVCFAGQQGADLRVGDRKLCGSAQVRRDGAVLQHGSVLVRRLDFDETDLFLGPRAATVTRAALRAATVTLEELAVPIDLDAIAHALIEGFRTALDLTFDLDMRFRVGVSTPAGG